jgi:hypothetical protein
MGYPQVMAAKPVSKAFVTLRPSVEPTTVERAPVANVGVHAWRRQERWVNWKHRAIKSSP